MHILKRVFLAVGFLWSLNQVLPGGEAVRLATFNIQELSWEKLNQADAEGRGIHPQVCAAAEVLQRVRPDIVLINEIDYTGPVDDDGPSPPDRDAVQALRERYLAVSQDGLEPLQYEYAYFAATNTGMPSGIDFNNNGRSNDPNDAYGFGRYPGEYGMLLLSRFPIDAKQTRTFRKLLWKDVPDNLMPDGQAGKPAFYTAESQSRFRLSSKSHWDVPVTIGGRTLHLLCSHPTPPIFDGSEDAHGRRNFDELRFWRDYLTEGNASRWIIDDRQQHGGLPADEFFVVLGDLNSDPVRSDQLAGKRAIELVLQHPRVADPQPKSRGATSGDYPARFAAGRPYRTSHFGRLDYALPCRELHITESGVFWPARDDPGHEAAEAASDHRLVWVDVEILER